MWVIEDFAENSAAKAGRKRLASVSCVVAIYDTPAPHIEGACIVEAHWPSSIPWGVIEICVYVKFPGELGLDFPYALPNVRPPNEVSWMVVYVTHFNNLLQAFLFSRTDHA